MKRLVLVCTLVGCVDSVTEPPAEPPKTPLAGNNDWWDPEMQGRHILGSTPDLLLTTEHYRVSNVSASPAGWRLSVTAAGPLGANGANLVATNFLGTVTHSGADVWFKNRQLTMTGPNGRQLRIRDVGVDGTSAVYYLDIFDPATGLWSDYCGGQGGAFAVSGGFTANRIHELGPSISFVCDDGVGKKCIRWGYVPGTAGPGDPDWDYHQACIQMANAAYCGATHGGLPFTREETPIVIRDFRANYAKPDPNAFPALPRPTFPGDPDTFYFEAAWRAGGRPPLCLSKLRWKSLPPNPCPQQLPDPRFDPNPEAKYCDDYTYADLRSMDGLLFQGSMMMDAPLDKWRNPSTNDVITTWRGLYSNINGNESGSIAPFPGYTDHISADGTILRNLTGTLDVNAMIKLYIQHDTNTGSTALVLSDGVDLPGYTHTEADFEGYAFPESSAPGTATLFNVCPVGSDFNTTINGCSPSVVGLMYALPPP